MTTKPVKSIPYVNKMVFSKYSDFLFKNWHLVTEIELMNVQMSSVLCVSEFTIYLKHQAQSTQEWHWLESNLPGFCFEFHLRVKGFGNFILLILFMFFLGFWWRRRESEEINFFERLSKKIVSIKLLYSFF